MTARRFRLKGCEKNAWVAGGVRVSAHPGGRDPTGTSNGAITNGTDGI